MPQIRISDAAQFLGVSDDTVRRWISKGQLRAEDDAHGRMVLDGAELAGFAKARASAPADSGSTRSSARNKFTGLVTAVHSDPVMSQVELQCGPFRVVSLLSTESVRELGLEPGVIATASVKATQVVLEKPVKEP
ncbi:TOBE domain-containing protein [Nesterenkonia sandarakina]|uniref:Molybdopterin-binding protein n=1 Tax=Nesterenkonia sandarakina TaxID=272918 RepID=A0A2T0YN31_9MICC|nr:TOBE domain-containing protein [Nesterenkonia sandarakina]PRZ16698.1 molybdopterin-binding protein [Nesterenkonia sandarakina]